MDFFLRWRSFHCFFSLTLFLTSSLLSSYLQHGSASACFFFGISSIYIGHIFPHSLTNLTLSVSRFTGILQFSKHVQVHLTSKPSFLWTICLTVTLRISQTGLFLSFLSKEPSSCLTMHSRLQLLNPKQNSTDQFHVRPKKIHSPIPKPKESLFCFSRISNRYSAKNSQKMSNENVVRAAINKRSQKLE